MDGIGKSKIGKILLRMWFPMLVFTIFMFLLIGKEELYGRFLSNFSEWVGSFFEYGSQIGVWLSGAFLMRFVNVFIWDGLIPGFRVAPSLACPKILRGCYFLASRAWGLWLLFLISQLQEFG